MLQCDVILFILLSVADFKMIRQSLASLDLSKLSFPLAIVRIYNIHIQVPVTRLIITYFAKIKSFSFEYDIYSANAF